MKVSIAGIDGSNGTDRMPVVATTNGATNDSPVAVATSHSAVSSSNVIATTSVSKVMSRRRSRRSATKFRYASISGCAGMVSGHIHSCWICSEKL